MSINGGKISGIFDMLHNEQGGRVLVLDSAVEGYIMAIDIKILVQTG